MCVAWNREGSEIASQSTDGTIKIWDPDAGANLKVIDAQPAGKNVVWSPKENVLASISNDYYKGIVSFWNPTTGEQIFNLTAAYVMIYFIAWSPDGNEFAAGFTNGAITIWDMTNHKILTNLTGHANYVNGLAWSPDGRRIASCSNDDTIKIWDVGTAQILKTLVMHTDYVNSISWSADGSRIASGSNDDTIRIWNATTGEDLSVMHLNKSAVKAVSWSPNGKRLASCALYDIIIWDENVSTNGNVPLHSSISLIVTMTIVFVIAIAIVGGIAYFRFKRRNVTNQSKYLPTPAPSMQAVPKMPPTSSPAPSPYSQPLMQPISQQPAQPSPYYSASPITPQMPPPTSAMPQTGQPTGMPIELKSALDFVSGYLVIKVGILNHSSYSLTRCGLSLEYNRKVFALEKVQPPAYEKDRTGDKVSIGEILPGDRRTTVEFYLDPYICSGGEISAIFSYHDHLGQPHDMRLQPKKVDIVCPVLTAQTIDPAMLNTPSMWAIYDRLAHKNARAIMVTGLPMDVAFEVACEVVERRNVKRVRKGTRPEGLVAWYYGRTARMEGATQEWDLLINVWRKPDCNSVEFMVAADSQGAITGLLSKLGEEFGEAVERRGVSRPVTKVINITDSVIYRSSLECA
jgi:hypothetical protein